MHSCLLSTLSYSTIFCDNIVSKKKYALTCIAARFAHFHIASGEHILLWMCLPENFWNIAFLLQKIQNHVRQINLNTRCEAEIWQIVGSWSLAANVDTLHRSWLKCWYPAKMHCNGRRLYRRNARWRASNSEESWRHHDVQTGGTRFVG